MSDFELEDRDYDRELEAEEARRSHDLAMQEINQAAWIERNEPALTKDLLSRRIRRPPWLFEDFLLSHSLTMISGEPFTGKSLCMMAMLASIDSGEPLFGSYPVAPYQRGLFIGQDSPTWDYYGQYQKLGRALSTPIEEFRSSMLLVNKGWSILDPAVLREISEAIDLFGVNVLMLDTLLDFHDLDENSNSEMKKIMTCLKALRDRYSMSVFFTTHTVKTTDGKSANYRSRGAGIIAGSVDQHIQISSHPEGGFKVKNPKVRGQDKKNETQYIKFAPAIINDEPALGLIHSEDLYRARQACIMAVFEDGKPHTRKEVIAALKIGFPEWDSVELGQRASNSLKFLVIRRLLQKAEWGVYLKFSEPASPKGASNPP